MNSRSFLKNKNGINEALVKDFNISDGRTKMECFSAKQFRKGEAMAYCYGNLMCRDMDCISSAGVVGDSFIAVNARECRTLV